MRSRLRQLGVHRTGRRRVARRAAGTRSRQSSCAEGDVPHGRRERDEERRDATSSAQQRPKHQGDFENDEEKFDRCVLDSGGSALVVSNFTLIADTAKGNRPSFTDAAPPEEAERLYGAFCSALRELGATVETGSFGARMRVELANDGPVTIVLDVD